MQKKDKYLQMFFGQEKNKLGILQENIPFLKSLD